MLILNDIVPYHWAIAGAGIALVVLLALVVLGARLGVSTGYESLCSLLIGAPYFRRGKLTESTPWRLPFLAGLVLGGALSAALGGGLSPTWELGMFDAHVGFGPAGKVAWMFAGGLLIGFGTRLANGCTSGHCIFGVSNLEKSGLVSTVCFMGTGVLTTNVLYRLVLGV